jgi:hypothetical protein
MARARRIDHEGPGRGFAVLIALGAAQQQDVLVAGVQVRRYRTGLPAPQQGGGRSGDAIAIKAMDIKLIIKSLPGNGVLPGGNRKKVLQFDPLECSWGVWISIQASLRGYRGFQNNFIFSTVVSSPQIPPSSVIIFSQAARIDGSKQEMASAT